MRIEILHLQNTDAELDVRMMISPHREDAIRLLRSNKYERVAVIETENWNEVGFDGDRRHLDSAWEATQNGVFTEGPWMTHECVEEQRVEWARSSMVGDIFVAGDMPFLVKGQGFECLVPGRDPV